MVEPEQLLGSQARSEQLSFGMTDRRPTVLKLVPEFSGEGDVSEWLEKVHTICYINGLRTDEDVVYIITLRIKGEAYRVVQQLEMSARCSVRGVEDALLKAYEPNLYDAYNMFRAREWKEGECVDGYLSALKKLAKLAGGTNERMITAAFVAGLPKDVQCVIRSGMGATEMQLKDVVDQARQIVNKRGLENAERCLAVAEERRRAPPTCFRCKKTGHFNRNCPTITCFRCDKHGHMARACPTISEQRGRQGNGNSE